MLSFYAPGEFSSGFVDLKLFYDFVSMNRILGVFFPMDGKLNLD